MREVNTTSTAYNCSTFNWDWVSARLSRDQALARDRAYYARELVSLNFVADEGVTGLDCATTASSRPELGTLNRMRVAALAVTPPIPAWECYNVPDARDTSQVAQ